MCVAFGALLHRGVLRPSFDLNAAALHQTVTRVRTPFSHENNGGRLVSLSTHPFAFT